MRFDEFDLTHQLAADAVGRSRAAVSNLLRLLELAPAVRVLLDNAKIDMGHARALLSLDPNKQTMLANRVIAEGLNVRQTEFEVRKLLQAPLPSKANASKKADPNIAALAQSLSEKLGARVSIEHTSSKVGGGKGKLVIGYSSLDELDGILARVK